MVDPLNRQKTLIRLAFAVSVLVLLGGAVGAEVEAVEISEYGIKAVFLYNFAKFTEWPEGTFNTPEESIDICILGEDPFEEAINAIAGKSVRNRNIVIRNCKRLEEARGCHILFISESEQSRVKEILRRLEGKPVLTVSDMNAFVEARGMIELIRADNKIRFRVHLGSVRGAGLKISSQMLKLAKRVVE